METSQQIRKSFPQLSILKNKTHANLFAGRDLPAFMQAYLLMRFTVGDTGVIDEEGLKEYMATKMTQDGGAVRSRLLAGEKVNLTCRFNVKSDLQDGMTAFTVSDIELGARAYILQSIVDDNKDSLCDGENWGNITMEYVFPEGRRKGYVNMVSYRPFRPLSVDLDYYRKARKGFTLPEWIDALVASNGYNPKAFIGADDKDTLKRKIEFCSRMLIAIEPRVNIIEQGPKGTGKTYFYNNNSKYLGLLSNGGTTRAELIYNRLTKQFGPLKIYDGLCFDEASTFVFKDNESTSTLKGCLEDGKVTIGKTEIITTCGVCFSGNIPLTEQMLPYGSDYYRHLPIIFRESALMDRFHGFIQGWRVPRLSVGSIYEGWAINIEYLSEILHSLRTCPEYGKLFDEIVSYDDAADLRDVKAVKKLATAFSKLFFPHIQTLDGLSESDKRAFIDEYEKYCLAPAIEKRGIIRQQCHLLDKEYKLEMPIFHTSFRKEATADADMSTASEEEVEPAESVDFETPVKNETSSSPGERIYVHSIFLSEGEFGGGDKERRMKLVEEAERWIEEQADKYGKKLKFVHGTVCSDTENVQSQIPRDANSPDGCITDGNYYLGLTNGHSDIGELLRTKDEFGCDKVALLVIVNAAGRSFAGWSGKGSDFLGTAVLYHEEDRESHSGVIAHELLHLLGADDLYAPIQSEEIASIIQENYPDEVMSQVFAPADRLTISPYTAWMVGWTDEKQEWFDGIVS